MALAGHSWVWGLLSREQSARFTEDSSQDSRASVMSLASSPPTSPQPSLWSCFPVFCSGAPDLRGLWAEPRLQERTESLHSWLLACSGEHVTGKCLGEGQCLSGGGDSLGKGAYLPVVCPRLSLSLGLDSNCLYPVSPKSPHTWDSG